jgi:hypothetical protein
MPERNNAKLLDVIALTEDIMEEGLSRGQVGTIVETHHDGAAEVEFLDESGRTFAIVTIQPDQMMVLHRAPARELNRTAE